MRRIRYCKACGRYLGYYTFREWKEISDICSHCCITVSLYTDLWDKVKTAYQTSMLVIAPRNEEMEQAEQDERYGRCEICRFAENCYGLKCYKQRSRDAGALQKGAREADDMRPTGTKRYPLEIYCE